MAKKVVSEESVESTNNLTPLTKAVAKVRLAAIAAIAEPMPFVAKAYAGQAEEFLGEVVELATDSVKDQKQLATAQRWAKAAASVGE